MSVRHIPGTLEAKGPFAGIVGFFSGAAMAFIIALILETHNDLCGISLKVRMDPTAPIGYSNQAPQTEIYV